MKVCVIGAGASGIAAIKCCLDEGVQPVCFEASDHIGGLWQYSPDLHERACVYKSTVINTSKEMMCFSDFPCPKEFPNFMHNTKVIEYLHLYAQEFDLKRHIRFKTRVVSCRQNTDHSETGRWRVCVKDLITDKESEMIFDGVLVCIGHHAIPNFRTDMFPGQEEFGGDIIHSHDYRTPDRFRDRNVLVVGIGNSAGDVAVETSTVAKQVHLSTRRGSWVLNRVSINGLPFDIVFNSRFGVKVLLETVPNFLLPVVNSFLERILCGRFDHEIYGLKPKHRFLSQHGMINDDLPTRILNGSIKIQRNVEGFTRNGVVFNGGREEKIDAAVFCTGYIYRFPFLDESIISVSNNRNSLYKYMWPTDLDRNTLAVIGLVQPNGAVNPISEMQSRWAVRVIKGQLKLPNRSSMRQDIASTELKVRERYYESERHTIQVDYLPYMDSVAEHIGAVPNLTQLLKKDILLALKVLFGPATSYQYRLNGAGSNFIKAKRHINEQIQNVFFPLKSGRPIKPRRSNILLVAIVTLFFLVIMFV